MKKIIGILLSACMLILLVSSLFTQEVSANNSWDGYHWGHAGVPFTVVLGNNVSPAWMPFVNYSAYNWNRSTVLDVPIIAGGTAPASCQMRSGTVQVCNAPYGSTGWLGLAQLTVSGKIITAATVKLNDTYFNQPRFNTNTWKNEVACQEVGHTLGLDHQDTNFNNPPLGTCMDYSNDPTPNQQPNLADYQELQRIYLYNDFSDTAVQDTALPSSVVNTDLNNKTQWGSLVSGSDRAATNDASVGSGSLQYAVYERDLGAGKKLNTVVLWAK
jgi:hypothetical protein